MITGINESKTLTKHSIYHAHVNIDSIKKVVIHINGGIMMRE